MSQMIEVKTAELIWPALDWAVALADGVDTSMEPSVTYSDASTGHKPKGRLYRLWLVSDVDPVQYAPSADWSQGGPMIEEYAVQLEPWAGYWVAKTDCRLGSNHYAKRDGESPLIAACRAIVAAKLGDVVSVPAELVGGSS